MTCQVTYAVPLHFVGSAGSRATHPPENQRSRPGGAFSMISQSLGLEVGGGEVERVEAQLRDSVRAFQDRGVFAMATVLRSERFPDDVRTSTPTCSGICATPPAARASSRATAARRARWPDGIPCGRAFKLGPRVWEVVKRTSQLRERYPGARR